MTPYKTKCGENIHVSPKAEIHLQAHPDVKKFLPGAIGQISLPTDALKYESEIDLGRVIGRSGVARTPLLGFEEQARFAIRKNRSLPSRIAPAGLLGEQTQKIVVVAGRSTVVQPYNLITAWIGPLAKKEPWDPTIRSQDEFEACLRFWRLHGIVFDPNVMGQVFESSWSEILENNCRFSPSL